MFMRNKWVATVVSIVMIFAFIPISSFAYDIGSELLAEKGELAKASSQEEASKQSEEVSNQDSSSQQASNKDQQTGSSNQADNTQQQTGSSNQADNTQQQTGSINQTDPTQQPDPSQRSEEDASINDDAAKAENTARAGEEGGNSREETSSDTSLEKASNRESMTVYLHPGGTRTDSIVEMFLAPNNSEYRATITADSQNPEGVATATVSNNPGVVKFVAGQNKGTAKFTLNYYVREGSYKTGYTYVQHEKLYTVIVIEKPLSVTITGSSTVEEDGTAQLGLQFTPVGFLSNASWESSDPEVLTVGANGLVRGESAGSATVTVTCEGENGQVTDSKEITVTKKSRPTAISITGDDTVAIFNKIQLQAAFTPEDVSADVTWTSSNSNVLTVSPSGEVLGISQGQATVTASAWGEDASGKKTVITDSKTITVTEVPDSQLITAKFFYLKTPTSDPDSNEVDQWGRDIGNGKITIKNAKWDAKNKNTFDNVGFRLIEAPDGFEKRGNIIVVPRSNAEDSDWMIIFNAFKMTITQLEGQDELTPDDVKEIIMIPHKISNNEDGYHMDCRVQIVAKDICTAQYMLWDAGSTGYDQKFAENKRAGQTTEPDETLKNLPSTKTVNGIKYNLVSWYGDPELAGKVTFPYTINSNKTFYAKYVEEDQYAVRYDLKGGSWNEGSSENHYENDIVFVKTAVPERRGYNFTGWTYSEAGVEGERPIEGGDTFKMPARDVTITAHWEKATPKVTLTTKGYTGVYDGQSHRGGEGDGGAVTITGADREEYTSIKYKVGEDGQWTTEEPSIKNVGEKTVYVKAESEYFDPLHGDYKLKVTPLALTVKIQGNTKTEVYDGSQKKVTGFTETVNAKNKAVPDNIDDVISIGLKNDQKAEATGTGVGNYPMNLTENSFHVNLLSGNYTIDSVSVTDGWLRITPIEAEVTVEITGNRDSLVYSGGEQKVQGYVTSIELPEALEGLYTEEDFSFKGSDVAEGKDVGTYPMGLSADNFQNDNVNFANVRFIVKDGNLEITKAVLTVKADDKSKRQGERNPRLTYSVSGFLGDDTADAIEGSPDLSTDAKVNSPEGRYDIDAAEGNLTSANYDFVFEKGILRITAAPDNDDPVDPVVIDDDDNGGNGGNNNTGGNGNNGGGGDGAPGIIVGAIDGTDGNDGNGGVGNTAENTTVKVDSEPTPAANRLLQDNCCILHLLIMLLALISLAAYTYDMKKRQRRIFELEEKYYQG